MLLRTTIRPEVANWRPLPPLSSIRYPLHCIDLSTALSRLQYSR